MPGAWRARSRAWWLGVTAELKNRLHHAAVRRRQARHRLNDVVKRQPHMPLARQSAPVFLRMIRRQQRQQIVVLKLRGDATEGIERADVDHDINA